MQLSTKYWWIKWIPLMLSIVFGAIVVGNGLEIEEIRDRPIVSGMAGIAGIAVLISVILWLVCKTTLCCPKCNYLVGSRYDSKICRRCGHRL